LEVNVKVKVYMDDSMRFVEEALKGFKVGVESNDAIRIRDAAKKAWNAAVHATNALVYYLDKTPSSH
jgi:hypothetical protein